MYNKSLAL